MDSPRRSTGEGRRSDRASRRGRRPGQSDTRDLILESAKRQFAMGGYEQTSIRGVAEEAGVDPALVMHYFSSKEGLLRAAMDWPFDMDEAARRVFEGDPGGMGDRLVCMVCEVWEDETTRHPLAVILRNTVERKEAAVLAAEFVEREMVGRVTAHARDPAGPLRGCLVHSVILGLVMARYIIGVEPLASAPLEVVVRTVGPTVQRYLAGDIGGVGGAA